MMSKQHFEWAAAYVRSLIAGGVEFAVVEGARESFVHMFRRFGPRFDESRFRAACEDAPASKRRRA